jgi:GT2 family glycosyltransferase
MAELSVLIVNYNSWRECAEAVRTLREHGPTRPDGTPMPYECIVVDNLSPQRDPELVARVERELRLLGEAQGDPASGRLVMHGENGGYSKGMNVAFRHSRGRWIVVSNPDVLFNRDLLPRLQRALERDPRAGITVPKGFWDPGFEGHLPPNTLPTLADAWTFTLGEFSRRLSRWHSRRLTQRWLRVWQASEPIALPMMSGCMFLIERSFFESIGLFDERYPLYFEDTDLSLAIRRAGRQVVQVPDARLVHFVNRSGMSDTEGLWQRHHVSRARYYEKWYGWRGRLTLWATKKLLTSKRLARWRRFQPEPPLVDLGEGDQPPVLRLPRRCERFVVLMSLDPHFYLAAGTFGAGDTWSPSPEAFRMFVHTTFYFAVYDLGGGRFDRLGTWRFHCQSHLGHSVRPPGPAGEHDPARQEQGAK